jgi:hypothetical protein
MIKEGLFKMHDCFAEDISMRIRPRSLRCGSAFVKNWYNEILLWVVF